MYEEMLSQMRALKLFQTHRFHALPKFRSAMKPHEYRKRTKNQN